ncbi:unnamed protein product [Caenorhabditis angaria]|uniref:MsrB domain-containing protein n=1 Tax=Caenorhabditis angaria TaxID=860376 RepID=A0A9P1IIZ2_9PELO|nr:unnamed protein product [Caenorhabditis angaria]
MMNSVYGFEEEILKRFPHTGSIIYKDALDMMKFMPLTAIIGTKILCMHGGISPHINSIKDLKNCRPVEGNSEVCLEMDLMWSDPSEEHWGFEPNKDRGGNALTFGSDVLDEFLEILGVDMIIRGHQVVQDGYAFNAGRKCVTVFLAAYYLGQFDNAAGVCLCCGVELFNSDSKFWAGCGWPAFSESVGKDLNIIRIQDNSHGMLRTEVSAIHILATFSMMVRKKRPAKDTV